MRRHPNRRREEGLWRERAWSSLGDDGLSVPWGVPLRSGQPRCSSELGGQPEEPPGASDPFLPSWCCGTHRGQTWWLFPKFRCASLEGPGKGPAHSPTLTPSPYLLCCFHFRHSTLWPCSPWKNGEKYRSEAKWSLWEGVPLVVPQGLGPGLAHSKHLINC